MNDADPIIPDASPTDESLAQTGCRLFRRSQISHLDRPVPWLWHGYVSRCQMTLLTGQWKIGKTTLLAALLARLGSGGTLAGRPVHPGRAVVITEEGAALWLKRLARHNIGEWVSFAFNPFIRKPLPRQWQYLLDDLSDLNRRLPIDLIVFDPLVAVLAGQEESSATAMTDALRPLRELAARGPGVLILHHPRKGLSLGGQGSRGTGVLPAFVDFLLEMHWPGPASVENRRRRLAAWSRHEETPRRVLTELSADGTDYTVAPDDLAEKAEPDDAVQDALESLLPVSDPAAGTPGLTVRDMHERWPPGLAKLSDSALHRRLLGLIDAGRVVRKGIGHRFSPYRFWVAGTRGEDEVEADGASLDGNR
jgi:hypothetical protein